MHVQMQKPAIIAGIFSDRILDKGDEMLMSGCCIAELLD